MKATLTNADKDTTKYTFEILHEGENYDVEIYCNHKGQFVEEIVSRCGEELDYEGHEGQIREDIIDYIDVNWDLLVDSSS